MLRIVVFDSGYGGEFFADRLEKELPVIEVIRVIDWRHAEDLQANPRLARRRAIDALRPYIGRVDLIVFANHLLSLTSLNYFRHRYRNQKFLGLQLKQPDPSKRATLVLTTKPVKKTLGFHKYLFQSKCRVETLTLDDWPSKIDEGELSLPEVRQTIKTFVQKEHFVPDAVVLACAQFEDIKSDIRHTFGCTIKIYDSFGDAILLIYKELKIRGRVGKGIGPKPLVCSPALRA